MVINIKDRWEGKGNFISGSKKLSWVNVCNHQDLFDISHNSGFSWSNKQAGNNYRSARLDRCYATADVIHDCWNVSAKIDQSLLVSYHKPLCLTFSKGNPEYRSRWPHIDYSLLRLPSIMSRTKEIISSHFGKASSATIAWDRAVTDIQKLFTLHRKHALDLRTQRRNSIMNQLNSLDVNSQEYIDCSLRLCKERYLEVRNSLALSREFWSENMDRNNKHMFSLMKKKKIRDFVPLIKKRKGGFTTNIETLHEAKCFLMDVFSVSPKWGEDIQRARATISMKRKK
ncbi:hypothetical protein KP509_29G014900 [Ceratopteris richardii]|uniref:Uncharacterized protein n=1 Tax=Ceratopteris richardii TaxID=49495 RepID=A0A8T2R6N7_CERRI|nr:hypothetical protein KP509_29G014900 [Ceratopteris richardii]